MVPNTITVAPSPASLPSKACSDIHSGTGYLMQCGAYATGQVSAGLTPLGLYLFGTDTYGSSNPGTSANFNCTYLSGENGGKDWTRAGLDAWHARGKPTCAVWETYATRAEDGYDAGVSDAINARDEAANLGIPTYSAIRFAVDTDTSAASVASYFRGAKSILGSRTGAYGSYYVIAGLENDGITTPRTDWQTLAWSYGNWGWACLEQVSINDWLDGESVDYDRARCANWGQEPYVQPPTIICFGKHAQGNATCRKVHAKVVAWQRAVASSIAVYRARGCVVAVADRNTLQGRWLWFHNALKAHPKVKRAKRERALAATGRALNRTRGHVHKADCIVFANRASYYSDKIARLKKEYT